MKPINWLAVAVAVVGIFAGLKFLGWYFVVTTLVGLVVFYVAYLAFVWLLRSLRALPRAVDDHLLGPFHRLAESVRRILRRWSEWSTTAKVVSATSVAVAVAVPIAYVAAPLTYHRLVLLTAPLLVGWTQAEPSYNAFVTPRFANPDRTDDVLLVREGTETTFLFGISPKWLADSLVRQAPDPRITRSISDIDLTVMLTCTFCGPHPAFVDHVTYRPKERSSNFVRFTFVPRVREEASGSTPTGRLVLSVLHNSTGQEYDRISIPVKVDRGLAPRSEEERVALAGDVAAGLNEKRDAAADVVLLAYEHEDKQVRIHLQPVRPDLKERLAKYVLEASDRPRVFITNVRGQGAVEKITTSAYARLSEIILPKGDARRRGDVTVSDESRLTSRLSVMEAAGVNEAFALTGRELYARLFVDVPERSLADAIELLENDEPRRPDSRPLNILVYTDLSLPWQYLLPVGRGVDASKFWGLRFNLQVQRTNLAVPSSRDDGVLESPRQVLFAKFAVTTDKSVAYADQQIDMLRSLSNVQVVESAKALVEAFEARRRNISAVVAFLHAASAQAVQDASSSTPTAPRLYFAPKDWIEVPELESLRYRRSADEIRMSPRFLRGAPLVILNACESGPSTIALPHTTLEAAMLELGAQGVIATEVPVWIPFAHEVGSRLIARLGKGESASEALTSVRRELYQNFNNPLGLLYAYYGGPSTTLRR